MWEIGREKRMKSPGRSQEVVASSLSAFLLSSLSHAHTHSLSHHHLPLYDYSASAALSPFQHPISTAGVPIGCDRQSAGPVDLGPAL